jgi:hypothetical protein
LIAKVAWQIFFGEISDGKTSGVDVIYNDPRISETGTRFWRVADVTLPLYGGSTESILKRGENSLCELSRNSCKVWLAKDDGVIPP